MNLPWSDPLAWAALSPALPLLGALLCGLFGRRLKEPLAGIIGSLTVAAAFLLSLVAFFAMRAEQSSLAIELWPFMPVAGLDLSLGLLLDPLAITFLLVITGVGTLIHVYSMGYMHGDDGYPRYFALLNLFVASMMVLVLADSFLLMFVGWEGVGVCSYLLIGFWYRQKANGDAGRKAFVVNRIGDAGFLLGSFLVVATFGTLNIAAVNAQAGTMAFGAGALTVIGLLFLLAATGKSAQFPLQVWLPDAMAGPTPVSALIHAATMVTAGVYLIARLSPIYASSVEASAAVAWVGALTAIGLLFLLAATGKSAQFPLQVWLPDAMAGPTPVSALIHAATMVTAGVYLIARLSPIYASSVEASAAVAWVGAITALIAALAALGQTDIKRILAYSTISQLGFMFVALGTGAYGAAVFHVVTHACFKALLFLGAGSVIHAMGGEQDVRRMGGLGSRMRLTGTTALIGTMAIAGVPLLAGFFSKDAILAGAWNSLQLENHGGQALYLLLLFTAGLTAFYMFRWYYLVFAGQSRADKAVMDRLHESPRRMTWPLIVLAVASVLTGYLGLPSFAFPNWIEAWLAPSLAHIGALHPALWVEWLLLLASVLAAAAGLGLGWWWYHRGDGAVPRRLAATPAGAASRSGLGFDAAYRALAVGPAEGLATGLAVADRDLLDRGVVAGAVGLGRAGRWVSAWQSGQVRSYALSTLIGVLLLTAVVLWRLLSAAGGGA